MDEEIYIKPLIMKPRVCFILFDKECLCMWSLLVNEGPLKDLLGLLGSSPLPISS